jgi:branched-chain amino acid transport system ATP-binding protein
MLEVEKLSAAYGAVPALHEVSFRADTGAVTAVLGANGAGKTTLLRTITSLVRPTGGRVRHDGEDLTGLPVEDLVRHGVAHVPEGRGVIVELTVEENLRLGTLSRRRRRTGRKASAPGTPSHAELDTVYELFPPLASRRKRPAGTLSGGERQMLAIGRALVSNPRVLLLDEPSLGLAPLVTAELMAVVRDITLREQLTVVLVEQNVRSALSISSRAVVLNLGRVVADEEAAALAGDEQLRHHYLGY